MVKKVLIFNNEDEYSDFCNAVELILQAVKSSGTLKDVPTSMTEMLVKYNDLDDYPFQDIRPEVVNFAVAMEEVLRKNDFKGGWQNMDKDSLMVRIDEESDELDNTTSDEETMKEAVDVANFAMMIYDNAKKNRC